MRISDWSSDVCSSDLPALTLHNDIVAPYLLRLTTEEQRQKWLVGLAAGDLTFAIAMSEPGAGSDLAGIRTSARREGDEWVINGQKTFISNGILSDVVIVVCRTDPEAGHKGFSLIAVERDPRTEAQTSELQSQKR